MTSTSGSTGVAEKPIEYSPGAQPAPPGSVFVSVSSVTKVAPLHFSFGPVRPHKSGVSSEMNAEYWPLGNRPVDSMVWVGAKIA
jgi:hypothetical protein